MKVEDLKQLIQKEEVLNNSKFKEELKTMLNSQHDSEVNWIPSSLSLSTHQYLVDNGLSADIILKHALNLDISYDQSLLEKQEKLIELAFQYGATTNNIEGSPITKSLISLKILMNNGYSADALLKSVLSSYKPYDMTNEGFVTKQEQIINLAFDHNANPNIITYFSKLPSLNILKKLLEHGFNANEALNLILNIDTTKYDSITNKYINDEEATELQQQLITLTTKKGSDIKAINQISINLPYTTYENLLQKGLRPDIVLESALSNYSGSVNDHTDVLEKKEKLINLTLSYKPDLNSIISYLPSMPSISLVNRLIDNGLSSDNALKMVLGVTVNRYDSLSSRYVPDQEAKELQQKLIKLLLEKGADINKIANQISLSDSMLEALHSNMEILLTHASNPLTPDNFLKITLNINVGGYEYSNGSSRYTIDPIKLELQGQLIQDALARGADINKVVDGIYPKIELLSNHKEMIVKHLSPDTLLLWVSAISRNYNGSDTQKENAELLSELVKFAIANGADVNANNNGETPLDMAQDPELIELLKSNGAKCNNLGIEEIVEGGLELALLNPSIIIEQKYKNLDATRSEEAKMPYIVHHIWLTSEDKPREIREQDLKIAFDTKDTFAKAPVSWEHIVWTNDKSLIPRSVNNLEDHGIKVRSIYNYKDDLSSFNIIEELITKQKWGMASDALRYSLVKEFGGIYADLNFILNRDMTDEAHKYNFFTKTYEEHYIDNFFFGASAHHPVVTKMVELVERNLVYPPKYLATIKNQDSRALTDIGTANPTFLAYYKEANKNGNIDVVYPMTKREDFYPYSVRAEDGSFVHVEPSFDFFDKESMQKHIELKKNKCPEHQIYTDFLEYIHDNEICGAEIFNIGHDSTDGQTWVA